MRALELIIWMILLVTSPIVLMSMQVFPVSLGTCDPQVCGVQSNILNIMNSTSLNQAPDLDMNNLASWDNVTFAVTYLAFAFFWVLFLLGMVAVVGPALVIMFHVPAAIALWLTLGQWIIYMIAYIQIKRGGLSLDGYR
jgi:hypothetical protein